MTFKRIAVFLTLLLPCWGQIINPPAVGAGAPPFAGPNPWIDVTNAAYGAVGNGVANDAAAIQAAEAVIEATGKGTLFFPCGVYEIGSTQLRIGTDGIGWQGAHGSPTIKTASTPCVDIKSSTTASITAPPALTSAGIGTACTTTDFGKVYLDQASVTGSLSNGTYQISVTYFDPYTSSTSESALSTPLSVTLAGGTATQALHVCGPDFNGKARFYRTYMNTTNPPANTNLVNAASACTNSSTSHNVPCWMGEQTDINAQGAGTGASGTGYSNAACMLLIESNTGPGVQLKVGPQIRNINFHSGNGGSGCFIHNNGASRTTLENVAIVGGTSASNGMIGFWNGSWQTGSPPFSDRVSLINTAFTNPWHALFQMPKGDMDLTSVDINLPSGSPACTPDTGNSDQDSCPAGLLMVGGRVDIRGHMDVGGSTNVNGVVADANAGFGTAKPVLLGWLTIENGISGETDVVFKNDTNNVLTLMCTTVAGSICVNADATSTGNTTTIMKATGNTVDYIDSTGTPSQNTWILPGYTKNTQSATITGADWTCGTGGTQSTCVTAKTISNFSFALPRVGTWTVTCDLIVGQATAATANSWNLQTATNAPTNLSGSFSMYTAASALLTGVVGPISSTATQPMAPTWTLGGIGTKMTAHLAGTVEVTNSAGTTLNVQLVAPTVGDLVTIFRGSSCQVY